MFTIIGKRFTPEEFETYVAGIDLSAWKPSFVAIHNTASPSLAQRPVGFTDQHIKNLQRYYSEERGWGGGPHLFIDDNEKGIIVFNPLNRRGVHSPSWNTSAWGVEHLGDFETESPTEGRGAKVVANGAAAVRTLLKKLGKAPSNASVKFHREDPLTDHACPGKLLTKPDYLALLSEPKPTTEWRLLVDGNEIASPILVGGSLYAPVRALCEALGVEVESDNVGKVVRVSGKGG